MIDPNVVRKKWTEREDLEILTLWQQIGNKWHDIGQRIEGRTEI